MSHPVGPAVLSKDGRPAPRPPDGWEHCGYQLRRRTTTSLTQPATHKLYPEITLRHLQPLVISVRDGLVSNLAKKMRDDHV